MSKIINKIHNLDFRTPIEIALDVDENGMTTAKKLYEFLELDRTHYSRWVKSNIIENDFAEENIDYWALAIDGERNFNPNPTQDFKLTAHFAKKLSCKGNGERAEQAREYFTRIEEKAKERAISRKHMSPQMQMLYGMLDQMAQTEREAKEAKQLAGDAIEIAQKAGRATERIKEAVKPVTDNWRDEINLKFNRIQKSAGIPFAELRSEMYDELESRAGCNLYIRLRNKRKRMRDKGCTKTEIDKANCMDVIEEDKKLREIFSKIVSEYEIRYCA